MTDKKKIRDFVPQVKNPNLHNTFGMRLLEKSIQNDGWIGAQTAAKDGEIIAGSARQEIAIEKFTDKDGKEVEPIIVESDGSRPVIIVRTDIENADTARARRLSAAENQIAKSNYNPDFELLKEWGGEDEQIKKLFSDDEWREGTGEEKPQVDAKPQTDRAAELAEKWQTKSGQLWKLGEHRLLIGDCTVRGNVERLMGGERIDLVFTSPPYAAQREYEIGSFDWDVLMLGMSSMAVEFSKDDVSLLVNLGLVHTDGKVALYWDKWIAWMNSDLIPLYGWYVWDKLSGLMGDWRGRLAPAHEFIFHFSNKPRQAHKTTQTKYAEQGVTHYKKDKVGLRGKDGTMNGFTSAGKEVNQTKVIDSVIRVQPQRGGMEGHPAPFSVEFAQTLIDVFSDTNHIVYEPFCGSGTSILACQNLARKCYSMELSDKYSGIILERFFTATGITPELVG